MDTLLYTAIVLTFCVYYTSPAIPPTTTWAMPPLPPSTPTPKMPPMPPTGCDYNGKHYDTWASFSPNPCEHCQCAPVNQTYCTMAECLFTPCVDYAQEPGKCCPSCPNGQNCKAPDGSILKKGQVYKPDSTTTCKCPSDAFGLMGNVAMCVSA